MGRTEANGFIIFEELTPNRVEETIEDTQKCIKVAKSNLTTFLFRTTNGFSSLRSFNADPKLLYEQAPL